MKDGDDTVNGKIKMKYIAMVVIFLLSATIVLSHSKDLTAIDGAALKKELIIVRQKLSNKGYNVIEVDDSKLGMIQILISKEDPTDKDIEKLKKDFQKITKNSYKIISCVKHMDILCISFDPTP